VRQLTIQTLKCNSTEDWSGADECRLEVYVDGAIQPYLRKSLNDRQSWTLNQSYTFKDNVEVKLWDEDSPDGDDYLGAVRIETGLVNGATAAFNRDGADYKLWYTVVDVPDLDPVQEAIDRFEQSSRPGIWPYIQKTALLADIRQTLSNPFSINQNYTPFCGPAAIVFELVSKQPSRYVAICQSLYETGSFQGRTKQVKPSQTLLTSKIRQGISEADWMLMAALRDTENALFPIDASSGEFVNNIAGITTPWEMKGWAYEILGYDQVNYESTYVYGEFEAIRKAHQVRQRGGVGFLMIDAAMLGGETPSVAYPNHWVSYLDGLQIDDGIWHRQDSGHIRFNCYSWGRKISVDLGEGPFEDYMWGVVTAY
jgi:hypothetical protein